jgi:division protein CdvB (Snf7/Vps24/ESCRT-III family)
MQLVKVGGVRGRRGHGRARALMAARVTRRTALNPNAREWSGKTNTMNKYLREINSVRRTTANRNASNMNKYLREINSVRRRSKTRRN